MGREDKGMYQCVVRRQEGDTLQASAELQLGGKWCFILYIDLMGDGYISF